MSEQYFAKKPGCESRPVAFETECVGVRASFETDAGVFSKGELDEGTRVLLEALPPLHGRALDLGCGWGAVGVLLGKKYPDVSLLMADVNERAVALAAKNLARNGVKNARAIRNTAGSFASSRRQKLQGLKKGWNRINIRRRNGRLSMPQGKETILRL